MRRRHFISGLAGAALAPLAQSRAFAQDSRGCEAPPTAADRGEPIDLAALCRMSDRLQAGGARIHAVLVSHHGRLVFERYFHGEDEVPGRLYGRQVDTVTFDAQTRHDMKSVTKSVASLAVGIAIDRGLIAGVDEPVWSFFPELADLRSPDKSEIRLSHLLGMTMGLDWVEASPSTGDIHNDEARMWMAWDPCRYVLGRPAKTPPGQSFFYNTGALMLVSAIMRKATKQPLGVFAQQALFAPLGITSAEWTSFRGITDAGGGLRLAPRDMIKLGQFVLAGGRWDDRQIVSRSWIEASTAARTVATDGLSYGYLWWAGQHRHEKRPLRWIGALGRGGQSIRIVPELDLVIAVTAGYYQDYSPEAFKAQYDVFADILRAVVPRR
jgi:CubicO group peptidase (beta-lactamase class C family)